MVDELVAAGSEHHAWPIGRKSLMTLRLVPRLRRWLRTESVDILHARSRVPAWVALLAWRNMPPDARPGFITTMHGAHSVNRYSQVMTRGEQVIAVSEFIRRHIQESYPETPMEKVRVIHRGVDPQAFPFGYRPPARWLSAWYRQYPQLRGKKVITLPGRLTRLKGHHPFIELIGELVGAGLPVAGLIVGGEDPRRKTYAAEIRHKAAALGQGVITFTGQRGDIKEIIAVSDLVLSLSQKPESFGRTVVEALSMGKPVLGYDHGGVGEILRDTFPQGLVPCADMQAVRERAEQILKKPLTMKPLERFRLDQMLEETMEVYAQFSR